MTNQTNIATAAVGAPVVCTLTDAAAAGQLLEWADLQAHASDVTVIDGGVRITLPASLAEQVTDLAQREAGCCAFLTINLAVADEHLTLDISSTNPEAFPVIAALAGVPVP